MYPPTPFDLLPLTSPWSFRAARVVLLAIIVVLAISAVVRACTLKCPSKVEVLPAADSAGDVEEQPLLGQSRNS